MKRKPVHDELLAILASGPVSAPQAGKMLGMHKNNTRRALMKLVDDGHARIRGFSQGPKAAFLFERVA